MAAFSNKRVRKKQKGSSSSWSDLPNDIMELIISRLYYVDQLNVRSVCKSWCSLDRIPPMKQAPWLLVFHNNSVRSCKLVDPKYKKTYTVDMRAINKKKKKIDNIDTMKVHQSKNGWLLFSSQYNIKKENTTSLLLYSPFLNSKNNFIELPILYGASNPSFATFSSDPWKDDCLFLAVHTTSGDDNQAGLIINTCRRGDHSWKTRIIKCGFSLSLNDFWTTWNYSEGILYYGYGGGKVGAFDFALEHWTVFPNSGSLLARIGYENYQVVKSNNELLLILSSNRITKTIVSGVLRLELSSPMATWEQLHNLGKRVVFLGDGYRSVLQCGGQRNDHGLLNGRIYYPSGFRSIKNKRKWPCTRQYGSIAATGYRKLWIDPPLVGSTQHSGTGINEMTNEEQQESQIRTQDLTWFTTRATSTIEQQFLY